MTQVMKNSNSSTSSTATNRCWQGRWVVSCQNQQRADFSTICCDAKPLKDKTLSSYSSRHYNRTSNSWDQKQPNRVSHRQLGTSSQCFIIKQAALAKHNWRVRWQSSLSKVIPSRHLTVALKTCIISLWVEQIEAVLQRHAMHPRTCLRIYLGYQMT